LITSGLFDQSSQTRSLSTISIEHLKSPYYEVQDFGFIRLTSSEKYAQTWYPTPTDIVPAGWFSLDIHNSTLGDFNGDGLVDLVLQPMIFPHQVLHDTIINPVFLLQDGSGGFRDPRSVVSASTFPDKHFLYRLASADFNKDGRTDVALSTMAEYNNVIGSTVSTGKQESPLVIFGAQTSRFTWTDTFSNFSLRDVPNRVKGYHDGHSVAAGDFNGDSYPDWFSNWHVFYNDRSGGFRSEVMLPNAAARFNAPTAQRTSAYDDQWWWPLVNSVVSADFNRDGFDDLVYSTMPNSDPTLNGGDLVLVRGSKTGLLGGDNVSVINRTNDIPGNIGTNFMVPLDVDGDSYSDLVFLEHYWTTDSSDSTYYYSKAKLRVFLGDGQGNLVESKSSIVDPYAGRRAGEGVIHVVDVNGDGWTDLVLTGYQVNLKEVWASASSHFDYSTVFLNDRGTLRYVERSELAYVEPYQFAGDESLKQWSERGVSKLVPVDLGNDGLVDFVGFVQTQLRAWPQVEQQYTYAYIVKAIAPLGRDQIDEVLVGTKGSDRIFGFNGSDRIAGGEGDDVIDGGVGSDAAIYSGSRKSYTVSKIDGGWRVKDELGHDGSDFLISIESLKFSDASLVFDASGNAGQAYRVYKAAFNRDPMNGDKGGLGYWIGQMDRGMSLQEVSARFIDSNEFRSLYGTSPSNAEFLTKVYQNVLGRQPEAEGYNWWLNQLNTNPEKTKAKVLADFAESPENQTGVLGLIGSGITYEPWVG